MGNLFPNTSLLKSPMNWLLVGFSVFILAIASHTLYKDDE